MTARKCRHRLSREVYSVLLYAESKGNAVTRRMCITCGAWISLGHSDETDPRVAIEVRAAEIAAGWSFTADEYDGESGYLARVIAEHEGGTT